MPSNKWRKTKVTENGSMYGDVVNPRPFETNGWLVGFYAVILQPGTVHARFNQRTPYGHWALGLPCGGRIDPFSLLILRYYMRKGVLLKRVTAFDTARSVVQGLLALLE
jgi:hypothetical protein